MARPSEQDPLEKFRFKVTIASTLNAASDTPVSGAFHDCQMPKRTTSKGTYREGNSPEVNSVFPGLSNMEDVILGRGVTLSSEFYKWISLVHSPADTTGGLNFRTTGQAKPAESPLFRKDVTIEMFDRTGAAVRSWTLYNAWPTHFTSGSDLNASEDGEKSMEAVTLAYEDFVDNVG